jgi:hypothetical protein
MSTHHPPTTSRVAVALALALAAGACRRTVTVTPAPTPAPSVTAAVTPAAAAHAPDAGYELRPAEKAAIDEFLRGHPELRMAVDGDHLEPEGGDDVAALYGVYHPYFVRGDGNDDGLLDFATAFVRRDSDEEAPWFSVVVFSGKPDGSFSAGGFLERDIALAEGDISLDRDAVVVTPDVSDDLTRRYRWDPAKRRHVFVRDDPSEDPASPPSSNI